jgi:WD40 repeat protein
VIAVSRQPQDQQEGAQLVIWDLATQRRVYESEIPGSDGPAPPGVIMTPSGKRIVIILLRRDDDGRQFIRFIGVDLATGKRFGEVDDMSVAGTMTFAPIDESKVIVSTTAGRIWSVDVEAGQIEGDIDTAPVKGEPPFAAPVSTSRDGKYFAVSVVGEPYTKYGVRLYDMQNRKPVHTFIGHRGPVTSIQFSADGHILATGAQDTSVLLWDLTALGLKK